MTEFILFSTHFQYPFLPSNPKKQDILFLTMWLPLWLHYVEKTCLNYVPQFQGKGGGGGGVLTGGT